MSTSLTVGDATAAPGHVASGWIDIPDGTDPGRASP